METLPSLSVVVPLYNEEENVEATVAEIRAKIYPRVVSCEIILVDDGSHDATARLAEAQAAADPSIRVVRHEGNLGYGAALRTGFEAASMPVIFYTDGDVQFDLDEIERLIPLLDGADIVTGYRINRQDPWHRRFNAGFYNLVMRTLFGVRLRDLDCAFKFYRKSIFDFIKLKSDGILISGEILVQAVQHSLVIREVGVTHYPRARGTPTGNKPLVVVAAMLDLAKFCWSQWRMKQRAVPASRSSR